MVYIFLVVKIVGKVYKQHKVRIFKPDRASFFFLLLRRLTQYSLHRFITFNSDWFGLESEAHTSNWWASCDGHRRKKWNWRLEFKSSTKQLVFHFNHEKKHEFICSPRHGVNTLGKGMNSSILAPAMGKYLGRQYSFASIL